MKSEQGAECWGKMDKVYRLEDVREEIQQSTDGRTVVVNISGVLWRPATRCAEGDSGCPVGHGESQVTDPVVPTGSIQHSVSSPNCPGLDTSEVLPTSYLQVMKPKFSCLRILKVKKSASLPAMQEPPYVSYFPNLANYKNLLGVCVLNKTTVAGPHPRRSET